MKKSVILCIVLYSIMLGFSEADSNNGFENHYGLYFDISSLDPQFDSADLLTTILDINTLIHYPIEAVKVLESGITWDLARLSQTSQINSKGLREDPHTILVISPDVARNPVRIHYILGLRKEMTEQERQKEKIESARRSELNQFFNQSNDNESNSAGLGSRIAGVSSQFMNGLHDAIYQDRESEDIKMYDYYLAFSDMFDHTKIASLIDTSTSIDNIQFNHTTIYPDGQLSGEYYLINGVHEGEAIEYYPNGVVMREMSYRHGQLHGLLKEFYENGKPFKEVLYRNGKEDGVFKVYYPNGHYQIIANYQLGLRTGTYQEFYENGKLKYEESYKNNRVEGKVREFYEIGAIKFEGEYVNNQQHGLSINYYLTGHIQYSAMYKNGQLDGKMASFYENGQPQAEWEYQNGQLNGFMLEFNESGELINESQYTLGNLINSINPLDVDLSAVNQ